MKIKKQFEIKGNPWSVDYKWNLKDSTGEVVDGLTLQETREILLRRELVLSEKEITFMHEFLHASLMELHLTGPSGVLPSEVEEILCAGLAEILLNTFDLKWKRVK